MWGRPVSDEAFVDQVIARAVWDLGRSRARELFIDPTHANGGEVPPDVLQYVLLMLGTDPTALIGLVSATLSEASGILDAKELLARRLAAVEGKLERTEAQLRDQQNVRFAVKRDVPFEDVPLPGIE